MRSWRAFAGIAARGNKDARPVRDRGTFGNGDAWEISRYFLGGGVTADGNRPRAGARAAPGEPRICELIGRISDSKIPEFRSELSNRKARIAKLRAQLCDGQRNRSTR